VEHRFGSVGAGAHALSSTVSCISGVPDSRLAPHRDRPVIITVISMWMMQVTVNQIVKMIAVGNALMCTPGTVYMSLVMSTTLMIRRTSIGICRVDFQDVFVNVVETCVL
jgi:hypothetical protein